MHHGSWLRRQAALFSAGSLVGTALDRAHVRRGVLSYRGGDGQPWWVAPQFGAAAVLIAAGAERAVGADEPVARPTTVAADAAWFVAAYLATAAWHRRPAALAAGVLAGTAVRARRRGAGGPVWFAAGLVAGGTAYEHCLSGTGAFGYADPRLGRVPAWLPALYLAGVPLALDVGSLQRRRAISGRSGPSPV